MLILGLALSISSLLSETDIPWHEKALNRPNIGGSYDKKKQLPGILPFFRKRDLILSASWKVPGWVTEQNGLLRSRVYRYF